MANVAKNAILRAKIEGLLTDIMVKTTASQVYVDDTTTLAAKLGTLALQSDLTALQQTVNALGALAQKDKVSQADLDEALAALIGAKAEASALTEEINRAKAAEEANAADAAAAQAAAEAAQAAAEAAQADADALEGRMNAVEGDIGNVDSLETTAKTLAEAVNEVRNAVSAGGTAAAITMDTTTTTEGMAKSYTIKQGDNVIGTIDIPKDMVIESGEVVTNPEGQPEGTYIKMVLANATNDVIYVNVGNLVDIYKAKESASQVELAIDSATREISATIVAGSITDTELAADAVVTAKIADGNVTKAKLSSAVQTSLDKADAAAPQTALDEEIERAKDAEKTNADAVETLRNDVNNFAGEIVGLIGELPEGFSEDGTLVQMISDSAQAAMSKANDAETNAKAHADNLNAAMNTRVEALEAIDHDHANKTVLDGITADTVSAWNGKGNIYYSASEPENMTANDLWFALV